MPPIFLIRHGESSWNTLGLAQGHNDRARLTRRGRRQAADANPSREPKGAPVPGLTSEEPATREEGRHRAKSARRRAGKQSLGVLEGTPSAAISPAVLGLEDGRVADPDARPAAGESVRDLYRRAAAFCDDLAATPDDGAAGDVVVVAHGGTLRVLHAYLNGVPVEEMSWEPLENARVLRIPDSATRTRGVA